MLFFIKRTTSQSIKRGKVFYSCLEKLHLLFFYVSAIFRIGAEPVIFHNSEFIFQFQSQKSFLAQVFRIKRKKFEVPKNGKLPKRNTSDVVLRKGLRPMYYNTNVDLKWKFYFLVLRPAVSLFYSCLIELVTKLFWTFWQKNF